VIAAALEHGDQWPRRVVVLFQDETSFYRQPSQGWLWSWAGRRQPRMAWSRRANTLVRVAGCVNAQTGDTHYMLASKITVPRLIESYRELLQAYPEALMIYLIQDNWPVHKHPKVQTFLEANPRLVPLFLPTYAPRLNPVEKVWRCLRQTLCHTHPYCDDFNQYKDLLDRTIKQVQKQPDMIYRYCGLGQVQILFA